MYAFRPMQTLQCLQYALGNLANRALGYPCGTPARQAGPAEARRVSDPRGWLHAARLAAQNEMEEIVDLSRLQILVQNRLFNNYYYFSSKYYIFQEFF